jgi:hypothetical protein
LYVITIIRDAIYSIYGFVRFTDEGIDSFPWILIRKFSTEVLRDAKAKNRKLSSINLVIRSTNGIAISKMKIIDSTFLKSMML